MPPNRKSSNLFTSSFEFESLKIPLQAKFLPLTDPRETAQQNEGQQELNTDQKTEKLTLTVSYWDWPSDTSKEEKFDEAIDDVFSSSRIESNLIADSIRREDSKVQIYVTNKKDQGEKIEEQRSYWDWSNEEINVIEAETDSEEDKSAPLSEYCHSEECCEDYWAWPKDKLSDDAYSEASPSHRLRNIVSESRKKFTRRHNHLPEPDSRADAKALSDHYWHWSEFRSSSAK